jgi:hypothetical protein
VIILFETHSIHVSYTVACSCPPPTPCPSTSPPSRASQVSTSNPKQVLPLSGEYLEALRRGEDTAGMAKSIMVQMGRLLVADCNDMQARPMLDEIVVCPLKTLGELTAECMLTAMKGLKPFSSSSVCPLSSRIKWMINVDIGDSARANLKLQDFEVAARDSASNSRRGVLPLQCNSHLTHLCSSSQADSLDMPPSWSLAASAIASAVEAPPGAQGAQVVAAAAVEPPAAPEPAAEAAQGLPLYRLCSFVFQQKTNKYVVFTTIMLVVVVVVVLNTQLVLC